MKLVPYIRRMIPASMVSLLRRHGKSFDPSQFRAWWKDFSTSVQGKKLPAELVSMMDYYVESPSIESASDLWRQLSRQNLIQMANEGLEGYRQSIAKRCYWGDKNLSSSQIQSLLANADKISVDLPLSEVFRLNSFCTPAESVQQNICIILMLDHLIKAGHKDAILRMGDSLEGSPSFIRYLEKNVTQDMLNSILEVDAIDQTKRIPNKASLLEIGAGQGRTAIGMIKHLSPSRYVIVDIPPALFLSQSHLAKIFPDRRLFAFRNFSNFDKVRSEFEKSQLMFLMPHQLSLLDRRQFDLVLAIDCLHEMEDRTIREIIEHAGRVGRHFYFKAQSKQWAQLDTKPRGMYDYPIPHTWKSIYHENCGVPNEYFHAFYQVS
jgi:putative sugar O-methyltransferase